MTDTTMPETGAEPGPYDTKGDDVDPHAPVRIFIDVTQKDPELRTIEATMILMEPLPYETQVRVLRYLRDRIEGDPTAWDTQMLTGPEQVSRHEVAQALAESDGRDWHTMTATHQSPYYRRAEALTTHDLAVVRTQ